MNRHALLTVIVLAALVTAGCNDNPVTPADQFSLGEPFTVREGQKIYSHSEKLTIQFNNVAYDGRCPIGVKCFWEGLAELDIGVIPDGSKGINVRAGITGSGDGLEYRAEAYEYTIIVKTLEPYPFSLEIMMPIVPLPYMATLTIEKDIHYPDIVKPVIITDAPPDSLQQDPFELSGLAIIGDTLNMLVRYGGGCKRHYFWLYMSPSVFMESEPVQANLYLKHFANNDMCEAYVADSLKFNLAPIRDLYEQMYGPQGSIRLNLFEYFTNQPGDFDTVLYSF
jgi:hypothetical protein